MSSNPVPTQNTLEPGIIHHMNGRLHRSGISSAEQTMESIHSGLSLLEHQMSRPKNRSWQGEAGFILATLKNQAADGLDIQLTQGSMSKEEHQEHVAYLGRAKHQASQALLSTASPIGAAASLAKNLDPLKAKCLEVCDGLQKLINQERHAHVDTQARSGITRERHKDQGGINKGL